MYEGKPPYADMHPMRAIFMIPTKPAPTFRDPKQCSPNYLEFVSKCLAKRPAERPAASELLKHEFITSALSPQIVLKNIIEQVMSIKVEIDLKG